MATFSHNGKLIATVDILGTYATLWDAKTGPKIVTLSGERAPIIDPSGGIGSMVYGSNVSALVFSADDRYVAAIDNSNNSKVNPSLPVVWDCETGQIVAWKADQENQLKLSIGNWTPTDVRKWNSGVRGKLPTNVESAKEEPRPISHIAMSADGSKLAVAGGNVRRYSYAKPSDSIEMWSLSGSQPPISIATGLYAVKSVSFSHNSQWLGAASQSKGMTGRYTETLVGSVRLWHVNDAVEKKLHLDNEEEWSATNVAFSADDKQLVATVFTQGELPEQDCPPEMHCGDPESLPYDVRTTFFDVATGRAVNSTPLGKSDSSEAEQQGFFWLSSDGRRAITMQSDQTKVKMVNTLTGREVGTFKPPKLLPYFSDAYPNDDCRSGLGGFGFAVFGNDGKQTAISDGDAVQIIDARTGADITANRLDKYITNDTSGGKGLAASFSPKGETLGVVVCDNGYSENGGLILYNTANLNKAAEFRADTVLTSLAFTPDGSLLFAGGYDGAVRMVETQHGSLLATLFRSATGEWIVFTPDGLYDASPNGASLLDWRLKGQIAPASTLPDMRQPGLLSMLIAGKRPTPAVPLNAALSKILSYSP
jgi:WD40 repeat protein